MKKLILFADDRKFHFMGENDVASNGNDGMAMISNTRWSIGTEWNLGYHEMHGYEVENHIGRYIGKMMGKCKKSDECHFKRKNNYRYLTLLFMI